MPEFRHGYPFDPTYGYDRASLLAVTAPSEPADFKAFWEARYRTARDIDPAPWTAPARPGPPGWRVRELRYRSTGGFSIGGWIAEPESGPVRRGVVVGHGYGGCPGVDYGLAEADMALLFPCFRGLGLSRRQPISEDPVYHVLHDIQDRDRYLLGGCVEDLWLAVSALLALHPRVRGRVGYAGISFGGGIGALALPWEERVALGALTVPTFGHHPLRLELPCVGSGESVRQFAAAHSHIRATLPYYDAAIAARHITIPMLVAAALFDPVVPPPGQFAVHNALPGAKTLFVLEAGHFDWPQRETRATELAAATRTFFARL